MCVSVKVFFFFLRETSVKVDLIDWFWQAAVGIASALLVLFLSLFKILLI